MSKLLAALRRLFGASDSVIPYARVYDCKPAAFKNNATTRNIFGGKQS